MLERLKGRLQDRRNKNLILLAKYLQNLQNPCFTPTEQDVKHNFLIIYVKVK